MFFLNIQILIWVGSPVFVVSSDNFDEERNMGRRHHNLSVMWRKIKVC